MDPWGEAGLSLRFGRLQSVLAPAHLKAPPGGWTPAAFYRAPRYGEPRATEEDLEELRELEEDAGAGGRERVDRDPGQHVVPRRAPAHARSQGLRPAGSVQSTAAMQRVLDVLVRAQAGGR